MLELVDEDDREGVAAIDGVMDGLAPNEREAERDEESVVLVL